MQLFHLVDRTALGSVLRKGLRYGEAGSFSKQEPVATANEYLDSQRPERLKRLRVSRSNCLYMYLSQDGSVHDIRTGTLCSLEEWMHTVDSSQAVVAVEVAEEAAYASDLDAYDAVAKAVDDDAPQITLYNLAERYWQQLWPLAGVLQYYRLSPKGLVLRQGAPADIPAGLRRIEVMVVGDVPADRIRALER